MLLVHCLMSWLFNVLQTTRSVSLQQVASAQFMCMNMTNLFHLISGIVGQGKTFMSPRSTLTPCKLQPVIIHKEKYSETEK